MPLCTNLHSLIACNLTLFISFYLGGSIIQHSHQICGARSRYDESGCKTDEVIDQQKDLHGG